MTTNKTKRPYGYWTKETVDIEIMERIKKGLDMSPKMVKIENKTLHIKGIEFYGGWKEALAAHGVDYRDWYTQELKGYWTEEAIIKEIKERLEKGLSLTLSIVMKEYPSLVPNGIKIFGSWVDALDAAGIDHNDWYRQRPDGYWTEEIIKKELLKRKTEGKSLVQTEVTKDNPALRGAVVKKFKSWKQGLIAIGEDPSKHAVQRERRNWSKETVVVELQLRNDNGLSLKSHDVLKEDSGLYRNATKYFGNWKTALSELK